MVGLSGALFGRAPSSAMNRSNASTGMRAPVLTLWVGPLRIGQTKTNRGIDRPGFARILCFDLLLLSSFILTSCSINPHPNVLLVAIDTLRADRLGCYGHSRAETPILDQLAREGVRFEMAFSPVPL